MSKRHALLSIFILCLAVLVQAQEQPRKLKFSGGPKLEANMSKYSLSPHAGVSSSMRAGMTAGGFCNWTYHLVLPLVWSCYFIIKIPILSKMGTIEFVIGVWRYLFMLCMCGIAVVDIAYM